MKRFAAAAFAAATYLATVAAVVAAQSQGAASADATVSRAVAYLTIEVPRWRREHPCYSCHNNGDAARALISAAGAGYNVGDAIDDTLAWLATPERWESNAQRGGSSELPLARIQFATTLASMVAWGRAGQEALDRAAAERGIVPGDVAFRLYDTYGLPRDFIEDMVEERRLTLDREGFERAMEAQRDKARAKSKFGTVAAGEAVAWQTRPDLGPLPDVFRGYDTTSVNTQIVELLDASRRPVDALKGGETGFAALAETPFYLQSGGQVSDVGRLSGPRGEAAVKEKVPAKYNAKSELSREVKAGKNQIDFELDAKGEVVQPATGD